MKLLKQLNDENAKVFVILWQGFPFPRPPSMGMHVRKTQFLQALYKEIATNHHFKGNG